MRCKQCAFENIEGAQFCAECGSSLEQNADAYAWIGQTIGGRYQVTSVLGEGGMGIVYTGEQQMGSTTRKVAIKTLHSHLSQDPNVVARFHRECATIAHLEHPNTIRVYDFGTEKDGTLYIAMEFLAGKSMDKILEAAGSLAPRRVVNILKQICGALHEAHEQGIVHRDLKPENIILGEKLGQNDFVKVLDFGIAARSESEDSEKEAKLTQKGMVLGTPPYMSPEQFMGIELDRRSDVYSLGVMTYEMLVGRLPFEASTPWQWATAHMSTAPLPMAEVSSGSLIPEPIRRVVMSALAKDPGDRPLSAESFLSLLEQGLGMPVIDARLKTAEMQAPFSAGSLKSHREKIEKSAEVGGEPALAGVNTLALELPVKKSWLGRALVFIFAVGGLGGLGAFLLMTPNAGETKQSDGLSAQGEKSFQATHKKRGESQPVKEMVPEKTGALQAETTSAIDNPAADQASTPSSPEQKAEKGSSPSPVKKSAQSKASPQKTQKETKQTPKAASPKKKQEAPVVAPPPPPADCSQCVSTIKTGNWSSALRMYQQCDAKEKRVCSLNAKRQALSQINQAKGNCKKILSIASAANQMSASSGRVRKAAKSCQ